MQASTVTTITGFTPASGLVGSQVVIVGTNFINVSAVAFNGTAAVNFTVNSPTQITATRARGRDHRGDHRDHPERHGHQQHQLLG